MDLEWDRTELPEGGEDIGRRYDGMPEGRNYKDHVHVLV